MNAELVVASVSGAVALSSVLLSSRFSRKQTLLAAQLDRQRAEQLKLAEHQDLMSQRRDPLLWAAYDLQSRLFNIVDGQFLDVYYAHGDDLDREHSARRGGLPSVRWSCCDVRSSSWISATARTPGPSSDI
ncbi:hypothetical protein [Streptomyces malaysiensis]|uniref:Uncharacterized protein n=1 Tax=Streptomyces malaysiensis TaxID=92644 RepID=A0A7X6B0V2_STRMQ|nr:hypothetical protein [Streptomyces malaysiensis]NIY69503.1 hypothetical protein [Streptomyces malaysiensis]